MGRYHYRLARKKEVIDWYNKQTERVKAATFIEQTLGSNESANVHLCIRGEHSRKIMFRIGRNGLKWFNTTQIGSPFMNERIFNVTGVAGKLTQPS